MGKLNRRLLQFFIIPIIVVLLMVVGYALLRPLVAASIMPQLSGEDDFGVSAYTKNKHGFSQVAVKLTQDQELILTDDRVNNVDVFTRGQYIVWVRELGEENQLLRYHLPSRQDVVIDQGGIYEFPKVDQRGQVTWQRWDDTQQSWFISYYSGKVINTMHQGIYPDIKERSIIFSQKNEVGEWQLTQLDLKKGSTEVLLTDPVTKQAWFGINTIQFPGGSIPLEKPSIKETYLEPAPFIDTAENTPEKGPEVESDVPPGDLWHYNGENPPSD